MSSKKNNGYILLYVMLAITLFALLGASIVKSTVEDVELGAQELAAVKAQSATDAALECFSYWARQPEFPFNTNTPAIPFNCDTGANSSVLSGINTGAQSQCVSHTAQYDLPELDNGSCAQVTIDIAPRLVQTVFPVTSPLCSIRIKAEGYDDCSEKTVSRIRWETIGGWSSASNPTNTATLTGSAPTTGSSAANGHGIDASVDAYAVLQVEVSGVAGSTHESNRIEIANQHVGAMAPLGEVVFYKLQDATALGAWSSSIIAEFDDGDATPIFTQFDESTTMRISVPGDLPEGFYRLGVRVSYGFDVYEDVVVYLDVNTSGRGQQ